MAQYLLDRPFRPQRMVMDFVDVDSDKWRQYAETHRGPMRWVYERESRLLLEFDRKVGKSFDTSTFISRAETELFKSLAPELTDKIACVKSGVDTDYFAPGNAYQNPYSDGAPVAVFTGTMDYWPNVDAVAWFAKDILPAVRQRAGDFQFYIVGASPNAQVQELAKLPGVHVTGRVEDVRPYVAHAAMSVAPLRVARGLQNKVLEAMAMAKIVVASPRAMAGIEPEAANHVVIAEAAADFSRAVLRVLEGGNAGLGARARECMLELYNWQKNLTGLLPHFAPVS
jgi:sugar transferase (PEP-CTERM/EpsH1 system associated)